MKYCPSCDSTKDRILFSKSSGRSDGLQSHCKTCRSNRRKKDYLKNRDKEIILSKVWVENNLDSVKAKARRHRKSDHGKAYYNNKNACRRASKQNATPKWLSTQQISDCKSLYSLATKLEMVCGIKYHVDHIVPLNGTNVCGLHVPWNLQVLEASLNTSKSNSYKGW